MNNARLVTVADLIARNAALNRALYSRPMLGREHLEFLYDLASVAVAGNGLEVGTYCGASLVAWALSRERFHGREQAPQWVIDPFAYRPDWVPPMLNQRQRFDQYMDLAGLSPTVLQGLSADMAGQVPADLAFAFIDGDHTLPGVTKDIELFAPRIISGGIIAFDDYGSEHPEKVGVYRAVEDWQAVERQAGRYWLYLGRVGNIVAWER